MDKPNLDFRKEEAAGVLRSWWQDLQKQPGDRAALRRAEGVVDVAFVPAFHGLRRRVSGFRYDADALASVAIVLANLRETERRDFARALGTPADHPPLSQLRLRRLLQAEGSDEVVRNVRRAVQILKGRADPVTVASAVYRLSVPGLRDQAARDFAYAYFDAAEAVPDDA